MADIYAKPIVCHHESGRVRCLSTPLLSTRLLSPTSECLSVRNGGLVDQPIVLQYLGFENKGALREYAFSLRGLRGKSSNYFVTISNDAFLAHRARYQDAPAICSIRLRREFASKVDLPSSFTFLVTDEELAEYKDAHTPKPGSVPWKSAKDKNS